jgi:phage baseplate assembly protein W
MGYRIQPVIDIRRQDIGLGVDLSFNNPGIFKTTYTTNNQAKANLKNLLLTRVGERYEQVLFGTNLLNILFQPNNEFTKQDISEEITSAINYWLPYIDIILIDIVTIEDDPTMLHSIKITLTYSVSAFNTDKITIITGENGSVTVD